MDETTGTTPAPEAPEPPYAPAPEAPAPPAPPAPPSPMASDVQDSNTRLMALLGWIFAPLGIIVLFLDQYKGNKWLRQHVIQAAGVWVVGAVLSTFTFGIVSVLLFIYQIVMGVKANNGDSVEVPIVYGVVKSMIEG